MSHVCALTGLEWRVFKSSCLPKKFRDEWSFGGLTYQVSGDPDGKILFIESIATVLSQGNPKLLHVGMKIFEHAFEFHCDGVKRRIFADYKRPE